MNQDQNKTEKMMIDNLLSQYNESKRIITQAKNDHQLVTFVGAGASIASGMPSWGQAVKNIANRLSIYDKDLDYLRIPQYYYNARGKKEYTQLMREIFRHGDYLPKHEIHDRVIEFDTETIITTNYDHLIEHAAEDSSQILSVVSKDTDLPYRHGGKELIKMHGDFENDNFVLKEDDYLGYSRNFKLIENYVKSLIGTKVVLFIGYSFNDPDLKLIFSCVKDILGGDFQRAYLIESGKSYDINEAEYFRNFGINILYASVQLQEQFDENDLTNNLLLMLKWLLEADKTDRLTELYKDLKPFSSMRYASKKYVKNALTKAGISSENGVLTIHDTIRMSDEEVQYIFKALVYEQWMRLRKDITLPKSILAKIYNIDNLSDAEIEEKQKQNNCRVAEYLNDFEPDNNKHSIVKEVLKILNKTSFVALQGHLKRESALGWYVATTPLDLPAVPEWMSHVNTFNYCELERIVEDNETHLSDNKPELYMEQGYLHFILGRYLSAYNCYRNAKTIYYRRQEYERFFIAEFSRYVLGKAISQCDGVICGVKPEDVVIVKEELKTIDLDRMFNSLPDLGGTNKVLKDLYTFNLAYTLFQDAYQNSGKVNEQANTKYSFFSGIAAFAGMNESISDYYNYLSINMLPVNNYIEHINIFRIYFQSIINSVAADDSQESNLWNNDVGSIHAIELQSFDILTALKFIDVKELEKMMRMIPHILPLSFDAVSYLTTVVKNCINRKPQSVFMYDTTFWKCIIILGHCTLTEEMVAIALKKINELATVADYNERTHIINSFVINAKNQDKLSSDSICGITTILDKIFAFLSNNKSYDISYKSLIVTLMWGVKTSGGLYTNDNLISDLIADETRMLCVSIYPFVSYDCQQIIKDAYSNWQFESVNQGFNFYYELVSEGIKKPEKDAEQKIIDYYNKSGEDIDANSFKGVISFPVRDENAFLYQMLDLYTKDLVIEKNSISEMLRRKSIPGFDWIINYSEYDYSLFDVKWLNLCTGSLLESISKDEKAKPQIKQAIESEYKAGKVNKDIIDIYFKYFAD